MSLAFGISNICVGIWNYVTCYFAIIPKLMYLLTNCFLSILDFFQLLVRKLAGLDVYYVDGSAREGDIVFHFLSGILAGEDFPALTTAFWSLIVLGIILLFISTFIAVIRSEYTTTKADNGKGKIIGRSLKSLMYFAIVPVACLLGVYLGNIVLQAIDSATTGTSGTSSILFSETTASGDSKTNILKAYTFTNTKVNQDGEEITEEVYQTYSAYNIFGFAIPTKSTTFSGVVFKAGAYQANRIRTTENQTVDVGWGTTVGGQGRSGFYDLMEQGYATNYNGLFLTNTDNYERAAEYIDEAFAAYVQLQTPTSLQTDDADYIACNFCINVLGFGTENLDSLNRYNIEQVWYYYDLWTFNFLVACAAGIIMAVIFVNIIFGLMRRIIELIGLFLISPPIVALMPMDDGKAYNKWKENFISKTISAYGAIAGMNIVFLILPYLNEIDFFPDSLNFFNILVSTVLMIVALSCVKSFIGMVSGFVGGENVEKAGSEIAEEVGGTIAKAGGMTAAMAAVTGGAVAVAVPRLIGKGIKGGVGFAKNAKKGKAEFNEEKNKLDQEAHDARINADDARFAEKTAGKKYDESVKKHLDAKNNLSRSQKDLDFFNTREGQEKATQELLASKKYNAFNIADGLNKMKAEKEAAVANGQRDVDFTKSQIDISKADYDAKTKARQDADAKLSEASKRVSELKKKDYTSFGKNMSAAWTNMHDTIIDAEGNSVKNGNFLTQNPLPPLIHSFKSFGDSAKDAIVGKGFMKELKSLETNVTSAISKSKSDKNKLKDAIKEAEKKIEAEKKAAEKVEKKLKQLEKKK